MYMKNNNNKKKKLTMLTEKEKKESEYIFYTREKKLIWILFSFCIYTASTQNTAVLENLR